MFNNKRFFIFENKKEQNYLKKIIEKTDIPSLKIMYNDFKDIISFKDLENFIIKYKTYIKKEIKIDFSKTLNDLKEEVAYELIESIYQKFNS